MATSESNINNFYPGVLRKIYHDSIIVKFEDLKMEGEKTYVQLYETKDNERCPIKLKEVKIAQIAAVGNIVLAEVFYMGATFPHKL